jgi:uncharacterized membrane protein
MLPAWPDWDGLHPFVVHFPIAFLLAAPAFVLLAMLTRTRSAGFRLTSLLLLVVGTAGIVVAMSTGKAAGELADHTPAINAVMLRHVELAQQSRNAFAALTLLYAALLTLPRWLKPLARPAVAFISHAIFLALLVGAGLLMVNASHQGGRLVHQLGVRAMLPPETSADTPK